MVAGAPAVLLAADIAAGASFTIRPIGGRRMGAARGAPLSAPLLTRSLQRRLHLRPACILPCALPSFPIVLRHGAQVFQPAGRRRSAAASPTLAARLLSPQQRRAAGISSLDLTLAMLAPAVVAALLWLAVSHVRRHGWRRMLATVFSQPGNRRRQVLCRSWFKPAAIQKHSLSLGPHTLCIGAFA